MRKILNIAIFGLLMTSMWSCSEDVLDDINKNINDPTDVTSNLIITDAMVTSGFSITGSDLAFYTSIYMEHNVGIWNQGYNAEIRVGEPISATTYNNSWNTMYNNMFNLKTIITKCSEGGSEEGNYHTLAMAQTLLAHNLATLTDLMGDVPWSEALQPGIIYTPKLDKQEDIYKEVNRLLDEALVNFDKDTKFAGLGAQDFIYKGNIGLWKKFANGLKARYIMRTSLINPNYDGVIDFANKSFAAASEQAQLTYNGSTMISPFYKFYTDRNYFGTSQSLYNKLEERNDPRIDVFWKPAAGTSEIEIAPNGNPDQVQGKYGISAISNATAPTYILSYHEIEFLKAEAYVRKGDLTSAQAALKNAVTAAMSKSNIGLKAEAEDYFENEVLPKFNSNPLSEVMNQKYIAFYEEEAVEAYCDYRRLVAMNSNVIKLENSKNAGGEFPLRLTYGNSDVTTNINVRNVYGDGRYVYSENVWWAGGTR
ncbi:MAG: SusD/RagB family nutrient-binding outer membrane lipoprotein [Chitinophagales bacterium]|nr:SusD/RagB family nutrient-binding outer membrane lipoprotein [Chitinophagales bacterium]